MAVKEIQEIIDSLYYWDARVIRLECNYFADEVELMYQDKEGNVIYRFLECYKSVFDHVKNYDKFMPVKNMTFSKIPYFLQSVEIGETSEEGNIFYTCKINMFPLYLDIWCKDIKIEIEENVIK